ncbi:hypothetical protein CVD25_00975 [Bacillus canaveralius]|uniref:Uncharacterized protein n=1 Tax=Bacillus canaveralius TaxID=1403243 RepID=A0A2N5GPK4_9BACI|nr:hypothetical protein [Bacillus canaveralius]PLR84639.1 hypothetical protein CU635_06085 [Bacillus canaveralius]PLS00791.1 hypothetical protein CVD25_00975 [Bacillus canaveralius]
MSDYYITPEDYAAAEELGVSQETVYQRVYVHGWSIKRAISTPLAKRNAYGWVENKHLAAQNGVPYRTYLNRVQAGWSFKEAAGTPSMARLDTVKAMNAAKQFVFSPEQLEEARRNGISPKNAWRRVKVLGWSIEDAVSRPVMSNEESLQRAKEAHNSFRQGNDDYWKLVIAKKVKEA